jgi:Holliday junction resolvase
MGTGSAYERELLHVLAGSSDGVDAVTRSCTPEERVRMRSIIEAPFLVVRAPGSGTEGTGDLLVLRGDAAFPIEVKCSKEPRLYLSGRTLDQHDALVATGERTGLMPLYAYRLKGTRGDSWRIFRVETSHVSGHMERLVAHVPLLPLTSRGRPHLDWNQGLPLNRFVHLLSTFAARKPSVISTGLNSGPALEGGTTMDVVASLMRARTV